MRAPIVVLGLGNPLMTDEGVGAVVVERLAQRAETRGRVEILDAGTGGMKLIHLLEGRQTALLVDCAYMQSPPGSLRRFTLEEVASCKRLADLSLHEGDLLKVIDLARQLGTCPPEVILFGIEPQHLGPGMSLSPVLAGRIDNYCQRVQAELDRLLEGRAND